uniref:Uncharacterized protein n=1 Tax=Eptatretus burgeri TaxID=7764 RepID=A0A8C4QZI5_EPTBU
MAELQADANHRTLAMRSQSPAQELKEAESLLRSHEKAEREINVTLQRVEWLSGEAKRLMSQQPAVCERLGKHQRTLNQAWEELKNEAKQRHTQLECALEELLFYNAAKELMKWMEDVQAKMATARQPQSVVEAESLLEVHKELQIEISAKRQRFDEVRACGAALLAVRHASRAEVRKELQQLSEAQGKLDDAWRDRNNLLTQALSFQVKCMIDPRGEK